MDDRNSLKLRPATGGAQKGARRRDGRRVFSPCADFLRTTHPGVHKQILGNSGGIKSQRLATNRGNGCSLPGH